MALELTSWGGTDLHAEINIHPETNRHTCIDRYTCRQTNACRNRQNADTGIPTGIDIHTETQTNM